MAEKASIHPQWELGIQTQALSLALPGSNTIVGNPVGSWAWEVRLIDEDINTLSYDSLPKQGDRVFLCQLYMPRCFH